MVTPEATDSSDTDTQGISDDAAGTGDDENAGNGTETGGDDGAEDTKDQDTDNEAAE